MNDKEKPPPLSDYFSYIAMKALVAQSVYELFDVCEEIFKDMKWEPLEDATLLELATYAQQEDMELFPILFKIYDRLFEFGAQQIPYGDWHWELDFD